MKITLALFFICLSVLASGENSGIIPEGSSGSMPKPLVYGRHEMVVTNNPWASKTASRILKQGGNAIDAAVAAAFVLGLTEPSASGLGGGGFALTYIQSSHDLTAYDGRETAPKSARNNMFMTASHQPMTFKEAMLNARSVGVPSEVALLYEMHRLQGRLSWASLCQPAIRLANHGFPMSPRLYHLLSIDKTVLEKNPAIQSVYFTSHGRIKGINQLVKNPSYAKTLSIIAKNPTDFYRGKIATDIITTVNRAAKQPIFSSSDLLAYKPIKDKPLCNPFRNYQVCTLPFASGGVTLLELLGIYANNHPSSDYNNSNWMFHFLQASKLAYADRNQYVADPRFVKLPLEGLLSSSYLKKRSRLVTEQALDTPVSAGVPMGANLNDAPDTAPKPHGTTSLAIVDQQENAVSMTLTIEHQFGSHLFVDGFFLNNELTDFSFLPRNHEGRWIANRVESLKRPRSAIASAMVFDQQGELVAISDSPGGSQIICYVAKNLIQMLDFNMNPRDSAASSNLCSVNSFSNMENNSSLLDFKSRLKAKGEMIIPRVLLSGSVNIKRASDKGWYGAADPRREGMAIGDGTLLR